LRTPEARRDARPGRAALAPEDDVGIEDREQGLEVAVARGREERLDDPALLAPAVGLGVARAPDASPRSARELTRRRDASLDDRRDLLERHAEHVVQYDREPLGRRERLEHDEHREADRVGEERLLLGTVVVV